MSDRLEVETLLLDYCDHLDTADVAAVVALFHDDAVVDAGPAQTVVGHDALDRFFRDRLVGTYAATSHHLSNVRITLAAPDAASASCSVQAWHQRHDGTQLLLWGRYVDEIERRRGRWCFARRTIRIAGSCDPATGRAVPMAIPTIARRSAPT